MIVPADTAEVLRHSDGDVEHPEERLPILPLPLTPLERFLYQCDTPESPMVIRVMLRFTGEWEMDLLLSTLQRAISRHPMMSCRIEKRDRQLIWVPGASEQIKVRRVEGSVFTPESGPLAKTIDLSKAVGLHGEIIVMDDGLQVILDAHHAVTDGNGVRQVVTEWLHLYHCETSGLPSRLPVIDPDRLRLRDRFPQPATTEPISFKDAVRNFLLTVRGRTSRWTSSGRGKLRSSEEIHSYCVEHILTAEEYEAMQQRLAAWKVTLNDLVMVSCMGTFAELAPPGSMGHRVTILNPVDLRLPSDRTLPAVNRFGLAFVRRLRSECRTPAKILPGIHDEMTYVRSNYIGAEFIKGFAAASGIPGGVNLVRALGLFIPSLQYTCLGDVTRGGRRLMPRKNGVVCSGGLKLETVTGFAPFAEHVPLSVATCEIGRRMTLTVRGASGYMTADDTQSFASTLMNRLCAFELPAEKSPEAEGREARKC